VGSWEMLDDMLGPRMIFPAEGGCWISVLRDAKPAFR
jgi:hypothetical protein